MFSLQKNIDDLMKVRASVYKSHGPLWSNSAMTNYTRGTFGVGQLITEAVEVSEKHGAREQHIAGFFYPEALAVVKNTRPSRVRAALMAFADANLIPKDALDLIVIDLSDAHLVARYNYSLGSVCGVDTLGRIVYQNK